MSIPKTIGRYEIIDELGRGAMGSVFRARDPAMDRIVALKTILSAALASEQGNEFRQRFYREARAAGALAHPGIVPVFDVGEHEGVPFLVMEFVSGQTLADAMKRGERASLDRVCEIGQMIAEALGYAHRNGVIHRDIKPANILLTSRQTYGTERPKITDFGVAKLAAGEITTSGQVLGTPAFMPPEQFTGAPIDGRTDLFSLGVILYWMATGEQPFPGETMTAVSYKIVHTEPVPPAKLNPAIPAGLEAVILKCLAKNPDSRYQTGEELGQVLWELRTNTKSPSLQNAIAPAAFAAGGSDDTIGLTRNVTPVAGPATVKPLPAQPPVPVSQAKPAKKRGILVPALVGVAAIAVVAGGGYLLLHRNQPATQQAASQQPAPAPAAQAPLPFLPAILQPATTKHTQAPAASQPASATAAKKPATPLAPSAAKPTVAAVAPAAQLVAVAFDPKKLDPKQNARLKFDLEHLPVTLPFKIELDGKVYFTGPAATREDYDNLYVPPGVHEMRVVVNAGAVQQTSNTVSAEFVAKKHMTLKVELKPQPNGTAAASAPLDPSTQVIATLKADRFSF
jgi:serine/threonine-protein kinase